MGQAGAICQGLHGRGVKSHRAGGAGVRLRHKKRPGQDPASLGLSGAAARQRIGSFDHCRSTDSVATMECPHQLDFGVPVKTPRGSPVVTKQLPGLRLVP